MKNKSIHMNSFQKFMNNAPLKLKLGLLILILLVLFALIVPSFYPGDPTLNHQVPPKQRPCLQYPLGTTSLGQDVLALLSYGLRNSLAIGIIVAVIGSIVGIIWGIFAGTFLVIPSLPVMILLTSMMNGAATLWQLALFISIFSWANPSRSIRTMVLSIRERDFIATARFSRENIWVIAFQEILPYLTSWALTNFMNTILFAISTESGLALLGLSSGDMVTLGNMIQWARNRSAIMAGYWYWIMPPVIVTVILFAALFFVINGYEEYKAIKRGKTYAES